MDFAYSRPFLYTVISSFRKDTVIFLYKEEKWRKYKIMSNIRIFDIPDEVLENESYKRISRRLNATKRPTEICATISYLPPTSSICTVRSMKKRIR